jgi:hypothetical protein
LGINALSSNVKTNEIPVLFKILLELMNLSERVPISSRNYSWVEVLPRRISFPIESRELPANVVAYLKDTAGNRINYR